MAFASFFATLVSLLLLLSFAAGKTQYFLWIGLSDPSEPGNLAGRAFGGIIALVAALAYALATWRYGHEVVAQFPALDRAAEEWGKVRSKGALAPDSAEAERLLENLSVIAPSSRIGKVIASWNDASPYSEAEAILEAEATPYRNFLNFLSSLASVLVLIGLVGNFFGLAEAAKNLPQLADVTSAKLIPHTTIQNHSQSLGRANKEVGREQTAAEEGDSHGLQMGAKILKITNGLQVVVVSSVMGIGGMIFLVIFVAYYRGIFNHLVAQEVLLLSTEIGSAIRPLHGNQTSATALQELAEGLKALTLAVGPIPTRLETFDKVASQLAASQLEMGAIVRQLDGALKQQLTQANQSYAEYKQVLQDFNAYLVDRYEALPALVQVSGNVGKQLVEMAERMQEVQKLFEAQVDLQNKHQVEFSNLALLLHTLAREDNGKFREFSQATVEEIRASLHQSAQELSRGGRESRQMLVDLVQEVRRQTERLTSQVEAHLGKAQESQASLVSGLKIQLEGLASIVKDHLTAAEQAQGGLVGAMKDSLSTNQQAQAGLLSGLKGQLEGLAGVVKDHLHSTRQAQEGLVTATRDNLGTTERAQESLVSEIKSLHTELQTAQASRLQQLTQGWRETQDQAARVLQSAQDSLGDLITGLPTSMATAFTQEFHRSLEPTTTALSRAAERSLVLLEEARQRLAEDSDRWRTTQDLALQSLFTRWSEEFSRLNGAAFAPGPTQVVSEMPSAWQDMRGYTEAALASLRQQQEDNRRWVSEVEKTLKTANQTLEASQNRLLESEERWRSRAEEKGRPEFPQLQQGLTRLDQCLERLAQLVCSECGAVTQQVDGYCQSCQASLSLACPQPVFLSKSWERMVAQADARQASIAQALESFSRALEQTSSSQPAAGPEVNLTPMLEALQRLQQEIAGLRQDNEQQQQQLLLLAQASETSPEPAPEPSSRLWGIFRRKPKK